MTRTHTPMRRVRQNGRIGRRQLFNIIMVFIFALFSMYYLNYVYKKEEENNKSKFLLISSFTRTYCSPQLHSCRTSKIFDSIPYVLINRECYSQFHANVEAVIDTSDFAKQNKMIETIVNPKDPQMPYPKEKWRGGLRNDSKIIMPPHYNKIFSLRKNMKNRLQENDYAVWLDSDQWIFNMSQTFENILSTNNVQFSIAVFPTSNSMFIVKNDEMGRNFLLTWLQLAKGEKIICDHRFGIPHHHDLYWMWVTLWHISSIEVDCTELIYVSHIWANIRKKTIWKKGTKLKDDSLLYKNILFMNDKYWDNIKQPEKRKSKFDVKDTFTIHSGYTGFSLKEECLRYKLNECILKYNCVPHIPTNDHRKEWTRIKLSGSCGENRPNNNILLNMMYGENSMHTSPKAIFGCEPWNCTCQGFSNAFGTYHRNWVNAKGRITAFWLKNKCRTKPMKNNNLIQIVEPIIEDPCGALENKNEKIFECFEF